MFDSYALRYLSLWQFYYAAGDWAAVSSALPPGYDVLVAAVLDSYFANARIRQVPASDTLLAAYDMCLAAVLH